MTTYKESVVDGNKWTRCCMMIIDNTFNRVPAVEFVEEERMVIDGEDFSKSLGSIRISFTDHMKEVELLDPMTDVPTGNFLTHGELYVALRSLYLAEAVARDERVANPPPEPEEVLP